MKVPPFTVEGEMLFRIGVGLSRVTVALALAVVSATLVAVTVTVFGFGKVCGATYIPAELMVPAVEFPPATPFTDQVTEVLVETGNRRGKRLSGACAHARGGGGYGYRHARHRLFLTLGGACSAGVGATRDADGGNKAKQLSSTAHDYSPWAFGQT